MTLTSPLTALFPGARAAVLRVLAGADTAFTGRQVAAIASPRSSLKAVQSALNALVAEGVVLREHVGRAHQYRFNHDHVAASGVLAILDGREEFFRRMTAELASWSLPPAAVWLFGSVATFTETPDSDVDLLVVRPHSVDAHEAQWEAQLRALRAHVQAWTGLPCNILEMSSTEVDTGWRHPEPVLHDVWSRGRTLWGPSVAEWFAELREKNVNVASREGPPQQGATVPDGSAKQP